MRINQGFTIVSLTLLVVISYSLGVYATTNQHELMAEKLLIQDSIVSMVNAIDSKQWANAEAQFTKDVFVDYSSLTQQPATTVNAVDLINVWSDLLAQVNTHHMLTNFDIVIDGDTAESYSHVYASHEAKNVEHWDAYGRYYHTLRKANSIWKITGMTLIMHGQKGNVDFLKHITELNNATQKNGEPLTMKKIQFDSDDDILVGHLYFPPNYSPGQKYPAVVVSGSWTTVKEQMSGLYAKQLSENGFMALAFDHKGFGESEGAPRFYENPLQKIKDIKHAVSYLHRLPEVDSHNIGALGICAGAMYTLVAASQDERIKRVVTVASWLHDDQAVKLFYGGEEGVQAKINMAQLAKEKFFATGEVDYIPSISTSDENAAMYGPYDYYLNPKRGAVKEWSADQFAVMSWEDWLRFNPMGSAEELTAPTLMIHSDGAVLPDYTKRYFDNIAAQDKSLYWIKTELESPYHQFNFYDQDSEVKESIAQATEWFNKL